MPRCLAMIAPIMALLLALPGSRAAEADKVADFSRGWAALRAMDCARCHGHDLNGWAAPSLIASVRDANLDATFRRPMI